MSALAALVLALIGAVLIASYVQGANQRAFAGTKTREILVVEKPVAAGTPVSQLAEFLQVKVIPVSAIADGAITSLGKFPNTIATVDLVPGEQLLSSRLADPSTLDAPATVAVPKGLEEVTIQLGPDRVVGGRIKAGDTVGVFISFADSGDKAATTRLVFQKVLVTNVQGAPAEPVSGNDTTAPAPGGAMLITLARSAADAERVIFAAQFGSIWLSSESADVTESGTSGVTQDNVYQ